MKFQADQKVLDNLLIEESYRAVKTAVRKEAMRKERVPKLAFYFTLWFRSWKYGFRLQPFRLFLE